MKIGRYCCSLISFQVYITSMDSNASGPRLLIAVLYHLHRRRVEGWVEDGGKDGGWWRKVDKESWRLGRKYGEWEWNNGGWVGKVVGWVRENWKKRELEAWWGGRGEGVGSWGYNRISSFSLHCCRGDQITPCNHPLFFFTLSVPRPIL